MNATIPISVSEAPVTSRVRWVGRVLSALPAFFLALDGVMKLALPEPVIASMDRIGMPSALSRGLGLLELACLVLYLVPRTASLGAVLLTGYLGGAVAMHLRIADPVLSHTLFPVYVGALVWAGLFLRDARVRALVA